MLPRTSIVVLAGGGAAVAGAWQAAGRWRALGPLALPALAVVLALLLATLFSVSPYLSLVGSYGRYESLPVRMSYLLLLCLPVWVLSSRSQRRLVISAFLAGCTIAACEALFEAFSGSLQRPDGNLGQANLFGALMAMAIPITAARARHRPAWALLLAPLCAGLLVSSSRSGWAGALAGSLALLPLLARTSRTRNTLAGVALLLFVGAAVVGLSSPLASLNRDNGSPRLHVWSDSLALIAGRPLLGFGLDSQGLELGRHLTGNWEPGSSFDRIHELGLDLLATQGAVGLAAAAWFWAGWAWRSVRGLASRRSSDLLRQEELPGLIAAWVGYLVVTSLNFDWAPVTAPLWLLAGVGWSALMTTTSRPAACGGFSRSRTAALSVSVSLVAVGVMLAFGILPLVADMAYFRNDLATAVALDPLQPRYHRVLGENLIGSGRLRPGIAELELAGRLGEMESASFVRLGDARLALGDRAGARSAYLRALELNRFDESARRRIATLAAGP